MGQQLCLLLKFLLVVLGAMLNFSNFFVLAGVVFNFNGSLRWFSATAYYSNFLGIVLVVVVC
jgi:hypothetical protein